MNITARRGQNHQTRPGNKNLLREFTGKYEAAFFEDLKTLNCRRPHPHARHEHIADIISLIEKLIARGIAYKAADGSVYFSIENTAAAAAPTASC